MEILGFVEKVNMKNEQFVSHDLIQNVQFRRCDVVGIVKLTTTN